ncbi:bifunctional adenosylcobinamide kinase/adenosylcobinamide-phosphate guanylyltransferase [Phenylobacterium sp.]|jgi:adenosylcobinamide kinase/adenosylcobinamide-phosphate guanylyltransferase|uniref:bifunctional adenosylcobinamide kinase/adenosylcobinamide-phosphate guanylyltransferase n=1 Tax=Phenylobacterium sp. TaxID=1871053 RepID=UPI002F40F428
MGLTLLLGGARSGKTRHALAAAQARAAETGGRLVMIATAEPLDAEMAARIARHRAERGGGWTTVEAPLGLAGAVRALGPADVAVIDCLTLWLSNLMGADADVDAEVEAFAEAASASPAALFLVSNEVGAGIVPDNALARRFRDAAGLANQRLARAADTVVAVIAGLPLRLKG